MAKVLIGYTWEIVNTDQTGSDTVPANGEIYFETVAVPNSTNTLRLLVDGEEVASQDSSAEPCQAVEPLVCTDVNFNTFAPFSYGDTQDTNGAVSVEDAGATLRITGNTWQQIAVDYIVTPNTMIEVDFSSSNLGEIHGVGFDAGSNNQAVSRDSVFRLGGSQGWGLSQYDTYDTYAPNTNRYTLMLGRFIDEGTYPYITFVNDHDVDNPTAESVFSNMRICEVDDPIIPTEPTSCSAQSVVSYTPGSAKAGTVVVERSDPTNALGTAQNNDTVNFVSLGFGGELILDFGQAVFNEEGDDLRVFETTYGDSTRSWTVYPEQAIVYGSQDGQNWITLGTARKDGGFDLGPLPWIQYVRLVDISDPDSFPGGATTDAFDVDAVEAVSTCGVAP